MKMKWIMAILVILALVIPITMAVAQGPGGRDGQHPGLGRLVYGVITSIDASRMVVEPRIPPGLASRMAEAGRELPELPAEIVLTLEAGTEYFKDGAAASADSFKTGDTVVIVTARDDGETRVAQKIADPETAREYIKKRMGEGGPGMRDGDGRGMREGKGWGMRDGEGQGMRGGDGPGMRDGEGRGMRGGGPGGPGGERRGRPAFGEIIAISDGQITIRPEIPEFVLAKMAEHGMEPPTDLPAEVDLSLCDRTRYVQNSEMVDENPFGVGDMVAIMAGRGAGDMPTAYLMSDWASAEVKLAEMADRWGERGDDQERGAGWRHGGRGSGQHSTGQSDEDK